MLKLRKENGSTLVTVIVIVSVLVILGAALADAAVQRYKNSRQEENAGFAYFAAETGIERCISFLDDLCKKPLLTNGIPFDSESDFADKVVQRIQTDASLGFVSKYTDIGVVEDSTSNTEVDIEISRVDQKKSPSGMEMEITMGIEARTKLVNGQYTSYGREVFAQRKFKVPVPSCFKLDEAICSIGDIMSSGINASITGDVNTYGTGPRLKAQLEQYYYGGVCAFNNSNLLIDGNVYTSAFIRTGKYVQSEDGSRIDVTKDAIAQCIQIFGRNDKILVHRNAYTFDDLENDGEKSIIGVKGSYFGLSGGGLYHDESSAVVNAAPVQCNMSDDSLKSRIVIDGCVFINGETMKIDPAANLSLYKMENASLAWLGGKPAYKEYEETQEQDDIDAGKEDAYRSEWLKSRTGISGFLNLFQVGWGDTGVDDWLSRIEAASNNNNSGLTFPVGIKGFCNYGMACNNSMEYMDENNYASSDIKSPGSDFVNTYTLDNVEYRDADDNLLGWNTFWSDLLNADGSEKSWSSFSDWFGSYKDIISSKLEAIKAALSGLTGKLVIRDFSSEGTEIKNIPREAPDLVDGVKIKNVFLCLQAKLKKSFPSNDPTNYLIRYGELADSELDANGTKLETISVPDPDKYYLIINDDPRRVLQLTSKLNGIIFTMGRVEAGYGANLTGSIIAAGRGYDPDSIVGGSAADYYETGGVSIPRVPVVDGESNIDNFENGDYSAVYFKPMGDPSNGIPVISFTDRDTLLNALKAQNTNLDLFSIF